MNFVRLLQLKGLFRAAHGVEATHLFIGFDHSKDIDLDSRPYGLVPVEVEDPTIFAVGILFDNDQP